MKATLTHVDVRAKSLRGTFSAEVEDGKLAGAPPTGDFDLRVADLTAGNRLFDLDLRRALEAKRFPLVTGSIREVEASEAQGNYVVHGDLRLRGVSQRVSGRVSFVPLAGGSLALDGEMTLRLDDFGIEPRRMLMLRVDPSVRVVAHVVAERLP